MARTKNTPIRKSPGKRPRKDKISKSSPHAPADILKQPHRRAVTEHPLKKKKRRFKSGTVALREIRKQQKSTQNLIPRASFGRLVREIAQAYKSDLRFTASALAAVQSAAETYLVRAFEQANILALHGKRVTVSAKDITTAGVLNALSEDMGKPIHTNTVQGYNRVIASTLRQPRRKRKHKKKKKKEQEVVPMDVEEKQPEPEKSDSEADEDFVPPVQEEEEEDSKDEEEGQSEKEPETPKKESVSKPDVLPDLLSKYND